MSFEVSLVEEGYQVELVDPDDLSPALILLLRSNATPYKGVYPDYSGLPASAVSGDYADVDAGAGTDLERYVWDKSDAKWVRGTGPTPSGTALRFEHDQSSASTTWVINHNFGKVPFAVNLVDTSGDDMLADIQHPDINTTNINFSSAVAGKAYLGA